MSGESNSLHDKLVRAARAYYEEMGNEVYEDIGEKRACLSRHGFNSTEVGIPDLVLEKDNKIAIAEVCVNPGQGEPFFRKLMKYRKVGKVFLLFPMNVSCIELDGIDPELEKEIWG